MTVDRNEVITIPKWILVVLLPLTVTAVTSFGIFRSQSAKQDEKLLNQEKKITYIETSKVNREEFIMLKEQLNRIESKIDKHLDTNQ